MQKVIRTLRSQLIAQSGDQTINPSSKRFSIQLIVVVPLGCVQSPNHHIATSPKPTPLPYGRGSDWGGASSTDSRFCAPHARTQSR
jgi:hypothetical protein